MKKTQASSEFATTDSNANLLGTSRQSNDLGARDVGNAFEYLKSLPPNLNKPALESYKRSRESQIIDYEVAGTFTDQFRNVSEPFLIPVSWTLTKSALVSLLGITSYEHFEEVNGVRFYAGLNGDNQLTLIAVSTKEGMGCNEDLTIEDNYPYYDYADPCPNNCSNQGNLSVKGGTSSSLKVRISE